MENHRVFSGMLEREGAVLRIRHIVLSLPLVVVSPALSLGADSPAVAALKEKGLTRSGRLFVLEAEKAVLEKWKDSRAAVAEYAAAARRRDEAERVAGDLAQLEGRRVELQQNLDELNQQINLQGFQPVNGRAGGFGQGAYLSQLMAQRNMIRMNLNEIAAMQKAFKTDAGTDRKAQDEETKKSLEAARSTLTDFRKSVDEVTKRYDELNSDASVKSALQALEKDKQGTFKLGPSAAFKSAVKALENAERTILARKAPAPARKKGRSRR